jgi:hypothetical protein
MQENKEQETEAVIRAEAVRQMQRHAAHEGRRTQQNSAE